MKLSVLSSTLFAALAVAKPAQHFHPRRAITANATEPQTTLTVFVTSERTVFSCAATITDCPARSSTEAVVVTDTITLATTICPVTAAASISSSIVSAASASGSLTFPASTAVPTHAYSVSPFPVSSASASSVVQFSLTPSSASSNAAVTGSSSAVASSAEESTTLTVLVTSVRTVFSCAASITDCPARSSTEARTVTDIITLSTTVCPVTAAASISSSIISAAASSSLASRTATGVAGITGPGTGIVPGVTSTAVSPIASGESTTLTVFVTSLRTVLSCAASVTNCPARSSTGGIVVTDTIALTTTVCPVTAAESISSSLVASVASASSNAAVTGSPSETVLTYTQGVGASQTVVTTTIKHTSITYNYVTVTKTNHVGATETGNAGVTAPAAETYPAGETGPAGGEGPTTTIRTSETSTRYITVSQISAVTTAVAEATTPVPGSACAIASTITVQAPAVTVTLPAVTETVTYSAMGGAGACGAGLVSTCVATVPEAVVSTAPVTAPVATITSASPYGMGNSTQPAGSTGFVTKSKSAAYSASPISSMAGW